MSRRAGLAIVGGVREMAGERFEAGGRRIATKLIWAATTAGQDAADVGVVRHAPPTMINSVPAAAALCRARRFGGTDSPTSCTATSRPGPAATTQPPGRTTSPRSLRDIARATVEVPGYPVAARLTPPQFSAVSARIQILDPCYTLHATRNSLNLTPLLMGFLLDDSLGVVDKLKLCTMRRLAWPGS